MSSTVRRQNHSCDQCRRSKRRCAFPNADRPLVDQSCINCARLGYECTFEFVQIQTVRKQQRRSYQARSKEKQGRTPQSDICQNGPLETDWNSFSSDALADGNPDLSIEPDLGGAADIFDEDWLQSDAVFLDFGWLSPKDPTPQTAGIRTVNDREVEETCTELEIMPSSRPSMAFSMSRMACSPMQLLNASVGATTLNKMFMGVYKRVVAGAASRFLSYSCNIFAGKDHYLLEHGTSPQYFATSAPEWSEAGSRRTTYSALLPESETIHRAQMFIRSCDTQNTERRSRPPVSRDRCQDQTMTLVGLAQFLDNFSDLYGNKLDVIARKRAKATLDIVIRAFSMQWLKRTDNPVYSCTTRVGPDPDGSPDSSDSAQSNVEAFVDAWSRARSHLLNTKSIRSFTTIFATFLFDMTVRPQGICDVGQPHEFLDEALKHLCHLQKSVKDYCRLLGKASVYATLMWSSLNVMRWFGFIRDTVSSFMSGRQCVLPEFVPKCQDPKPYDPTTPFLFPTNLSNQPDIGIQEISRLAMTDMFLSWRLIIRLREHFEPSRHVLPVSPAQISVDIGSLLAALDNFEAKFGSFLKGCQKNFVALSRESKTSSAFNIIFSNLGLLVTAEQLLNALDTHGIVCESDLSLKVQLYQTTGTSSIAEMVNQIFLHSTGEESDLLSHLGKGMSVMADHINIGLVVLAMIKGIEHSILLRAGGGLDHQQEGQSYPVRDPSTLWTGHIKTLMQCLLSLNETVVGSLPARTALDDLLRQHGDTLMDCWVPGDEVVVQSQLAHSPTNPSHERDEWSLSPPFVLV